MAEESKRVIEQLAVEQKRVGELTTALDALQKTHADVLKELESAKTAHAAKVLEMQTALDKATADVATGAKALTDESTAHGNTKAELLTAKAALANPAFADAAIKGAPGAGHEGGAAASGGALADGGYATQAEAQAAYANIEDAKAREDFRKRHWKALGIAEEK